MYVDDQSWKMTYVLEKYKERTETKDEKSFFLLFM